MLPAKAVAHKAVAKSEGCRGERVGNCGVHGRVVGVAVAPWLQLQLKNVQNFGSQNDGQPLVESDVLHNGTDNFSRFMKKPANCVNKITSEKVQE